MTVTGNNKPTLRNATRPLATHALNLSRAVSEIETTGKPVTQSIEPKLRLRDALVNGE